MVQPGKGVSMYETKTCPLCDCEAVGAWPMVPPGHEQLGLDIRSVIRMNCTRCGHYEMAWDFGPPLVTASKGGDFLDGYNVDKAKEYVKSRHLLSGLTRSHWERGGKELRLTFQNVDGLLESAQVPKTPAQCVDALVRCLRDRSSWYGGEVPLDKTTDWPLAYASGPTEFYFLLQQACDDGYARKRTREVMKKEVSLGTWVLEMKGWRRAEELDQTRAYSKQAFVATWFDGQLDEVYEKAISPALGETGWEPLWLKLTKDCGKIDDQITAGIMQSGLMIADFTGHRASVYFEAGLAKGLGIPTILTCREDEKDSDMAGFDIEHYRHIYWAEPAQLKKKLVDFIGHMGLDRTKPLPPSMSAGGGR